MALVLTVIECCIDEWTEGTYRVSNWSEVRYKTAYLSHISSLSELRDHLRPQGGELLAQIQHDLLEGARIHAGAPFETVTGSGRIPLERLYTAVYEEPPAYDGPDNGSQIPMINISAEP